MNAINLLKLSPDNLRKAPTGLYIDILQQKTKKAVTVGVADPVVIELLENKFPRKVSQVIFNKQIKALCRMAGIDVVWCLGLRTTQRREERKLFLRRSLNLLPHIL